MDKKKILFDNPEETSVENKTSDTRKEDENIDNNDPKSPLAYGLPSWSIEPPAVVVRRKVRAL